MVAPTDGRGLCGGRGGLACRLGFRREWGNALRNPWSRLRARSIRGSESPPGFHSRPRSRFATPPLRSGNAAFPCRGEHCSSARPAKTIPPSFSCENATLSLRLGHLAVLTVPRTVIHYRSAASLPFTQGRHRSVIAPISCRGGFPPIGRDFAKRLMPTWKVRPRAPPSSLCTSPASPARR